MPIPSKSPKIEFRTAKERIYNEVREWIVSGVLQPGEKVSDQELAQYFSVSRTPVREAIQMLSDHKLINIFPGRETRVSAVNLDEAVPNYRIMAELHALVLEFAYPHITDETIQELRDIDQAFTIAAKHRNVRDAVALDSRFHGLLTRLAGNHFLSEFTNVLGCHIQRIENIFYQKNDLFTFDAHSEIIDALVRRDLEAAKQAMRHNWLRTLENLRGAQ